MTNPSTRIAEQVPLHYREYAPTFVEFMKRYYEWLHRKSGLSKIESDSLINSIGESAAVAIKSNLNPGAASDLLAETILMEEIHEEFLTADDEYLVDPDDTLMQTHKLNQDAVDSWFKSYGTSRATTTDPVLLVSLMKHINGIKGTQKSIELFFNLFFGENVQVYYPKFDIAVIDDNFIPDVSGVIRDDYYYNEFSYVIRVNGEVNRYEEIFNSVYMKNVHPAGFKVFLEQA